MASIMQPTRASALRRSHLSLLAQRRVVWALLFLVSLAVVGICMLQRDPASQVTTTRPLATAYDDDIFSITSSHTQMRPLTSSGDAAPGLDAPPPFDDSLYFLQLTSGSTEPLPLVTKTPPPLADSYPPFRGATE